MSSRGIVSPRKSVSSSLSVKTANVKGVGGGGEIEGGSVESTVYREAVRLAEQQALTSIGKYMFKVSL